MATEAVEKKPCSRCGERPRRGKHAWCGPCQNDARKTKRATNDTTNAVTNDQRAETPLSIARAEVEALRLEVANLKRELARRPGDPVRPVTFQGAPIVWDETPGKVCIHGSRNCGTLYCKSQG